MHDILWLLLTSLLTGWMMFRTRKEEHFSGKKQVQEIVNKYKLLAEFARLPIPHSVMPVARIRRFPVKRMSGNGSFPSHPVHGGFNNRHSYPPALPHPQELG